MPPFTWTSLPELRSTRLLLRTLSPNDSADLFAIYGDPDVMEFASDPPFADASMVVQMLESTDHLFHEHQALEWGVVHVNEQRVIGTCGIHSFTADGSAAEIGCLLARRYWGQGLMAEALTAVIDLAFDTLKLTAVLADIDAPNQRSQRLFHRLGFQLDPPRAPLLALSADGWRARRG